MIWKAKDDDGVDFLAKLADGPEITIESWRAELWDSIAMREEAIAYYRKRRSGITGAGKTEIFINGI